MLNIQSICAICNFYKIGLNILFSKTYLWGRKHYTKSLFLIDLKMIMFRIPRRFLLQLIWNSSRALTFESKNSCSLLKLLCPFEQDKDLSIGQYLRVEFFYSEEKRCTVWNTLADLQKKKRASLWYVCCKWGNPSSKWMP